jgi:outer membrane receptor protein involved in Fe transport
MNSLKSNLIFYLLFLFSLPSISQASISGTVRDHNNLPLENATILLEPLNISTNTNAKGAFTINTIANGSYTISVYFLGYKAKKQTIEISSTNLNLDFNLEPDLLNLQTVIVTGTFDPRINLESSTSVSTLNSKELQNNFPRGTANLLQDIPGTFVDASAGEVFTRVYTRGISASAEDDMGWYYVSLQEDGLPVSLVQHSYYSPDLFHRYDLTTKKVEAIRGGSSSITAMNAPGGIYNFISHGVHKNLGGIIQVSGGLQGENNPLYRIDGTIGGPLGNNWFFNAGGHYRNDEGVRNSDFTFSKGGQFKFNLIKENSRGYFKFYGKILNDKTNRYTGVAATNWDNPTPAFGQDFRTSAVMMPGFNGNIPDGRNLADKATNSFDPSQGVHAKDIAFGLGFSQTLGNNWVLKNNMKFSSKNANWQTSISNAFISINDFTPYYLVSNGNPFPVGQLVFRDTASGSEIARIDNSGLFTGDPVEYLTDSTLPNDALMGTSAWYKDNKADEFIQQLILRKEMQNHDLSLGFATGFSDTSVFTQGSFAFATYENNPKMLHVTLENPNEPVIQLTDKQGLSNHGGLFFTNNMAKVSQIAAFVNDRWKLSDNIILDLGLRSESIKHKGSNDFFAPFIQQGGLDQDETTAYDNNILEPTGTMDAFNYTYNYVSYSAGLNYILSNDISLFSRFSRGNKAPELNYYFNNFSNVPINKKGEVQKITQIEAGIKLNSKNLSFTGTAFWSKLKDIGTTNFEFDEDEGTIFYTPILFNTSRTIGFEWESVFTPIPFLSFEFNGVIQDPKAIEWFVYDAGGTVDPSDDTILDFSGNTLAFNPKLMFNLGTVYQKNKLSSFFKWQFMGKRQGNVSNGFELPSYSVFNAGLGYKIDKNWSIDLLINNVFNSAGLANFFGENSFGASASGSTPDFVQANPDASFVVVPILPRSALLKVSYVF